MPYLRKGLLWDGLCVVPVPSLHTKCHIKVLVTRTSEWDLIWELSSEM